jgi:hypothetical protein
MAIERWTNPKPLGANLDSGTIPNGLEGFWIRHHSRTKFCRAVPDPNVTIRNFFIAVCWRGTAMQKLRIVMLRFGTARQKRLLESKPLGKILKRAAI